MGRQRQLLCPLPRSGGVLTPVGIPRGAPGSRRVRFGPGMEEQVVGKLPFGPPQTQDCGLCSKTHQVVCRRKRKMAGRTRSSLPTDQRRRNTTIPGMAGGSGRFSGPGAHLLKARREPWSCLGYHQVVSAAQASWVLAPSPPMADGPPGTRDADPSALSSPTTTKASAIGYQSQQGPLRSLLPITRLPLPKVIPIVTAQLH